MPPRDDTYILEAHRRAEEKKTHVSFPQLKYPSLRDDSFKDSDLWLTGKAMDDGAEGLWRIYDKIYDLNEFMKRHPGGQDWLYLTKGTDITEAFEAHHMDPAVADLLPKFYIRDAKTPRNSPFTFKEDGFYKSLKRAVNEELKKIPKNTSRISKIIWWSLLFVFVTLAITSCVVDNTLSWISIVVGGIFLGWFTVASHNYLHMKDNFYMYGFGMSMNSIREWRVSHALSHHLYPNTLMDMEISMTEPLLPHLPRKKTFYKYLVPLVELLVFPLFFPWGFVRRALLIFLRKDYLRRMWKLDDLVCFTLPLTMWIVTGAPIATVLTNWFLMVMTCSLTVNGIGFNAAHHDPDIFHDGDQPPAEYIDFGVHELSAVMDRPEINKSYFRVLTFFGDHALHHLFPTMDHAVLHQLYPVFLEQCKKHKANFKQKSSFQLLCGQIAQAIREDPHPISSSKIY